jgi:hypothetical protein
MKTSRLSSLFGIVLATAFVGARGSPCGECGDQIEVITLYPDAGASDAGTGTPREWTPSKEQCDRTCGSNHVSCRGVGVGTGDGGVVPGIECTRRAECGAGRRPAGLMAVRDEAWPRDDAACWLASAAHLEEASVHAFSRLRHELAAHRAPRRLLRAASRAARDERRHARTMRALVRRRGARAPAVEVAMHLPRSLLALAIENAIEGCVRETWSALLAHHQARHARDPLVRAAMARIAVDETRHAALAWSIDRHLCRRFDRTTRAHLEALRSREARAVMAALEGGRPRDEALGLPGPEMATALADGLYRALGIPVGKTE